MNTLMETRTMHPSALYRTMWRSVMHALGNAETADQVMSSIVDAHPHLAEVWEDNTCRACKAILSPLDKAEASPYCECCRMDNDPPEYYERNVKMYGGE
jgi:hypothetical protein